MDPEKIHEYSMDLFKSFPSFFHFLPHFKSSDNKFALNDGHMQWKFPIGLAAGFDKNAQAIDFFNALGFGAVEVGTVTPLPQEGNPRPRIHRLPELKSVRNSMGFPNAGMEKIYQNISAAQKKGILGINLGKNKLTSIQDTPADYRTLYQRFVTQADYLVINVSSPNTEGLRDFQNPVGLKSIFDALSDVRQENPKPLYLKISPDMQQEDVYRLVDLAKGYKLAGIIATNTTTQHNYGAGGLSGDYIRPFARAVRKYACEAAKECKELSIIGVGGVDSAKDLIEFLQDGGSFMQIYTSFIYQGPQILLNIARDLDNHLRQVGADNLQQWVDSLKTAN